jgi:hypothetical protein
MSEQVSIQDLDGKRISGRYVIKDGVVTVTAADGRTMRGPFINARCLVTLKRLSE